MSKYIITIPADREHLANIESLTVGLRAYEATVEPLVYDADDIAILNTTITERTNERDELHRRLIQSDDLLARTIEALRQAEELRDSHNEGLNRCGQELMIARERISELERNAEAMVLQFKRLNTDLDAARGVIEQERAQREKLMGTIRSFIGDMVRSGELDIDALIVRSLLSFGMQPFSRTASAVVDFGALEVRYGIEGVPDEITDDDIEAKLLELAINEWEQMLRGDSLDITIKDVELEANHRGVDLIRRGIRILID